jgi:signal peptidase
MKLGMKSLVGNLLFIAILLLISTRILSVIAGTPFPIDLITANSMSPSLMEGDIVAWTPVDIEEVHEGDVIVFKSWLSWPDEKLVVHRVVEIREIWGKPAFVTKGDANTYTDQAGPHIPEPYVTEKNFIGKTLSIGNQPLKIPFIGYIGIWLNNVFKGLAQPSAGKDPVTFIGVFTPLTISVILLILGVFILPEKNNTPKEKLRHYIFGSHGLDIKKVFISFLTIYVVFLIIIHCFAYDSTSASLGVGEFPESSSFQLGSVIPGQTTMPKDLPVFNSGILPIKGVIYGSGDLSGFVDRTIFEVAPGDSEIIPITATATLDVENGVYNGDVMIYSSPLWLMFPNELIHHLLTWTGEGTVLCLDLLLAAILSVFTLLLIISTAYVYQKFSSLTLDISWRYAPPLYAKLALKQKLVTSICKVKQIIGKKVGWIIRLNFEDINIQKPILASLIIIPILFLLSNEMLAMTVTAIAAGIIAFFISCKVRVKIVLTTLLTMTIAIIFSIAKTDQYLLTSNRTAIEILALSIGALGTYLLVLSLLLLPLSLIAWYIAKRIRNLKEQKDPLLILEGSCDL